MLARLLPYVALVLASSALFSYGQTQAPQFANPPSDGRVAEWMYGEHIPPIAKEPFTARVELETVNQLADGTLMTHKTFNIIARDLLGRTRNEARRWMDATSTTDPPVIRVELYDPQTHTRTTIFLLTKTVRKWTQAAAPVAATSAEQPLAGKHETSREELGVDTIEGLPVRGVRVNQTYPPGVLGNDRPLTISTESWFSQELKVNLLTKRTDPRYGVQTVRVTELRREEPSESLFAIPQDYRIEDQTGSERQALAESSSDSRSLSALPAGVFRPGLDGVTVPSCVYCPPPSYSDEARAAKFSGRVVLRVVVTAEGQAENIQVLKGPGREFGIEQSAIDAVGQWKFKPATDRSGKPVATVVPVEVTFRIR
jgi:TonB family protein